MDIEQLPYCLDLLSNSGMTLNHEKSNLLMNSLIILQSENHFEKVYFWGIIYGLTDDYYIAFGYTKDVLKGRTFYYSQNAITWVLLPILSPKDKAHHLSYISTNLFQGDPRLIVEVTDEWPKNEKVVPKEEAIEEEEYENTEGTGREIESEMRESTQRYSVNEISSYELKEEDRLAATIRFINQEAAVIPRGSLFKRTTGRVVPNEAFAGLQTNEASLLTNYLHYRIPKEKWEVNVGIRPDYNYATDFFDNISQDIPINGVWSIHLVQGNRYAMLYNHYWPGYAFYHQLNSKIHGFIYIGNGLRNIDLPHMI